MADLRSDDGRDELDLDSNENTGQSLLRGDIPLTTLDTLEIIDESQSGYDQRYKLYISHSVATWNSRLVEFGSVLFLSTLYPSTLLPSSIYALVRALSAVVFASYVGTLVDRTGRLTVIRLSIAGQRSATAFTCVLLYLLTVWDRTLSHAWPLLLVLAILACVEKLSATMNTIAIERDWVVVLAGKSEQYLQTMNSQMRRIDLFCKLVAPLIIALIDGYSTKIAILITFSVAVVSLPLEYVLISKVYYAVKELHVQPMTRHESLPSTPSSRTTISSSISRTLFSAISDLRYYNTHAAFLPSISLSLLYLTVLSFNGQMINYLISLSYSSTSIGILRTFSAICELSATFLAPLVMNRIGAIRAGIWFLNSQLVFISIAASSLWFTNDSPASWANIAFLAGVIPSRVGLWGFDLSAQILIQEDVEAEGRGRFSAIEAGFQNAFELLGFASTIVFSRPDQFRFPAAISAGSVAVASVFYALFVRRARGHLVHVSDCVKGRGQKESERQQRQSRGWSRVPQHDDRRDIEM
ncbi:hypothetical protein MBLNU457_5740t1 [Dothideomycetes sp. NU457]